MHSNSAPRERTGSSGKVPGWVAGGAVALLLAGALLTWWTVQRTDQKMREVLLAEASLIAQCLQTERAMLLSGDESDLANPQYQRLKQDLTTLRRSNTDYRFIYLLGREHGGEVFIFVDSEPPESPDYSPPGDRYAEAPVEAHLALDAKVSTVAGPYDDRWGTWVSALVPISASHTGEVIAALGIDVAAQDWTDVLIRAAVPPVLVTLIVLCALIAGGFLSTLRTRTGASGRSISGRVEPLLVALVGVALTLFGAWLAQQNEEWTREKVFSQLAMSRTDVVADTLRDLREIELPGLANYFEGSEHVTSAEFKSYTAHLAGNVAVDVWQWIAAVPAANRASFEAEAVQRGEVLPQFWEGAGPGLRTAASERDCYYPIVHAAPAEREAIYLGYDVGSDPTLGAAVKEAQSTMLPTASAPALMNGTGEGAPGFCLFLPVSQRDDPAAVTGFAAAVVPLGSLLRAVATDGATLTSISYLRDDGTKELMVAELDGTAQSTGGPVVTRPIAVWGILLSVDSHPGDVFLRLYPTRAWWLTLLIGLLLTAALTTIVSMVLRRRDELERLVIERTASLSESEARYRELFEQSMDAISLSTHEGRGIEANRAWLELFGYDAQDVPHLEAKDLYVDLADRDDMLAQIAATGFARDEVRFRRKDATEFDCDRTVTALRDASGALVGYQSVNHDVTERNRAEQSLRRSEQMMRELAVHLEEVREEERTGIARELHDQVGQSLTAIRMDLLTVARAARTGKPVDLERIDAVVKLVDAATDDVRRISSELRPGILDDIGLAAAIEWQMDQFRTRTGIESILTASSLAEPERSTSTALYRVFQELLTNIVRHAEARSVRVDLVQRDNSYVLTVTDDGRGITQHEIDNTTSLGLIGIRERLRPLGGQIAFEGSPGKGTTVRITVPTR
jgi:PAS domain S-box-containing protein